MEEHIAIKIMMHSIFWATILFLFGMMEKYQNGFYGIGIIIMIIAYCLFMMKNSSNLNKEKSK